MKNEEELSELCRLICSGILEGQPIELPLDDFRPLYEALVETNDRRLPQVVILNLSDQAYAMFPQWSRQEILIRANRPITPDDFSFISSSALDWRGAREPMQQFPRFLVHEFSSHKIRTLLFALVALGVLLLAGPTQSTIDLLSTLLIQASTVFLSIYLIFTVSQSERLSGDRKLFNSGILHRYYSDDRNITAFAIATVAVVFMNAVVAHLSFVSDSLSIPFPYSIGKWVTAICSSLAITMLFHTFFVVANYYLERTRDLAERDHVGLILEEEYIKYHPDDLR